MSMIDVLTRVDAICKKYDRYDADKHRNDAADPFSRLYADIDAAIDEAVEVSPLILPEINATFLARSLSDSCTSLLILPEMPRVRFMNFRNRRGPRRRRTGRPR
jgi:hypothetical protein